MAFFLPGIFFGNVMLAGVFTLNAICILSEDRFLARVGFGSARQEPGFGQSVDTTSFAAKVVGLINSIRAVARVPLIFVNLLVALYLLMLG